MKIRTCRREAKEANYWLRLTISGDNMELMNEKELLRQEAKELTLIFNSILKKRLEQK